MKRDEYAVIEELIESQQSILLCTETTETEETLGVRFSFGEAARYVRWISLYFLPHSQFTPRKLGVFRFTGSEEDINNLEKRFLFSVDLPGVLRAFVDFEGFGVWEYSREVAHPRGEVSTV